MTIQYYRDLIQGGDEWLAARCGLLTASEMKLIITPTLKIADNDKTRAHVWELAAQRRTKFVEAHYISDDMLRGQEDEIEARDLYSKRYAPVETVGFVTNDEWGFTIGYSPDGMVGDKGGIEAKSRRQKFQFETIAECVLGQTVPAEFQIQIQTGLLVTKWEWIDFISYCGGQPMVTIRAWPDAKIQGAILDAAHAFEKRVREKTFAYDQALISGARLVPTERRIIEEIHV